MAGGITGPSRAQITAAFGVKDEKKVGSFAGRACKWIDKHMGGDKNAGLIKSIGLLVPRLLAKAVVSAPLGAVGTLWHTGRAVIALTDALAGGGTEMAKAHLKAAGEDFLRCVIGTATVAATVIGAGTVLTAVAGAGAATSAALSAGAAAAPGLTSTAVAAAATHGGAALGAATGSTTALGVGAGIGVSQRLLRKDSREYKQVVRLLRNKKYNKAKKAYKKLSSDQRIKFNRQLATLPYSKQQFIKAQLGLSP